MSLLTILYDVILSPITQLIEISYRVFNKMFDNTGFAILGVSLTVTLLCLPLYIVAESWQETERQIQKTMKKGIDRIKTAFKSDEQYMMLTTFYKQNKYHPIMALRSSFGILIQIPFFLAAYHTLSALPDLMGHSFLFIQDMGKPDAIFKIGNFDVNILPITMTLINCVSGTIYSKGHEFKEKMQIYGMALLFLVVLYNSPAGLVVYWTMNNVFSLVKNVFYKMKNPVKVFYICVVVSLAALALYILFIYSGGASFKKRSIAALFLLIWIPIPLYLKGIDFLLKNQFKPLLEQNGKRFAIFALSAFGLTVLNGLVLPSSLISSSVTEFSNIESYGNPTAFLHSSFWMSTGLFVFWPVCVYFLFNKKIQTIISYLFAAFFIGALVNAYVFSGSYGSMDSTLKFIDGFKNPSALFMILNIAAAFACILAVGLLVKFNGLKIYTNISIIVISAFTVLSVYNISRITGEYKEFQAAQNASLIDTPEDETAAKFSLSRTDKNVVIFMLDRFESAFVPAILNDNPSIAEKLSGFVYYPNCLSFNGHTLMGSPGVYGGYEYTPLEMNKRKDVLLKDKHNEALMLLPRILTEQAGYNAYVSDLSWGNYSYVSDMTFAQNQENITPLHLLSRYSGDFKKSCLKNTDDGFSLSHVMNRNLFWVSLFREAPACLRPVIYYRGTWWENGVKESSDSFTDWFSALYYMPKITDFASSKPTVSIITNECTHSSEDISMYEFEEKLSYASNPEDKAYIIDCVALNQIGEFVKFLKENEAFDNTKIIVVSDHGIGKANNLYKSMVFDGLIKDKLNCVLLVKDFNSNSEIKTDNTFMTNADVPSIALKDIITNPVNPFTDNPVSSDYKENGVTVTKADIFMPSHTKSKYEFTIKEDEWIHVKDNIFVDENWNKISK